MFSIGDFARLMSTLAPATATTPSIVHRGSIETIDPAAQALARWIDPNGYQSTGYPREVNLECPETATTG